MLNVACEGELVMRLKAERAHTDHSYSPQVSFSMSPGLQCGQRRGEDEGVEDGVEVLAVAVTVLATIEPYSSVPSRLRRAEARPRDHGSRLVVWCIDGLPAVVRKARSAGCACGVIRAMRHHTARRARVVPVATHVARQRRLPCKSPYQDFGLAGDNILDVSTRVVTRPMNG